MSGIHWKQYEDCRNGTNRMARTPVCLTQQIPLCKSAEHRGIKVLRLVLDNVAGLLDANKNLKVLHLFRDPRAILNSRQTTRWYHFPNTFNRNVSVLQRKAHDANRLCHRMLREARAAEVLRRKYPDRFGVLLYEDLFDNTIYKLKNIFSFLNIHMTEEQWDEFQIGVIDKRTLNVKHVKTDKKFTSWWRSTIEYTLVRQIDLVCNDLYDVLGYIPVDGIEMLNDLSIPLHNFNFDLQIEGLSSGNSYDSLVVHR